MSGRVEYNKEGQKCEVCGASLYPDGICSAGCDDLDEDYYEQWTPAPDPDFGRDEPDPRNEEDWEDWDSHGGRGER